MEGFTNGSGCHLKKYWSSAKKDLDMVFLFWLNVRNVSHYIYYLTTDNIHIVLENDNTVLIKDLKRL